MITKLYSVEGGLLEFDSTVPCFIAAYTGFVESKNFRDQCEYGLTQITEKIQEHGKVSWITDLRKAEIFIDEDVQWANEYWNTNALANGLQYCALIMPKSTFATMNVEEYLEEHERRKDSLVIKLFEDVPSAARWCKEMLAH